MSAEERVAPVARAWQDPALWRVWAAQAGIGVALGGLLVVDIFLIELAAGWVTVYGIAPAAVAVPALLGGAARAVLVAAIEETLFRGVLLGYLLRPLGLPVAVTGSALAFALVHSWNAGATWLALVNLAAAGGLFALAYLVGRGLALPIGLHAAWNLVEGSVFGFPVSGNVRDSLLRVATAGPEWATGGAFGPEGGLVGLKAIVVIALVLWAGRRYVPVPLQPAVAGKCAGSGEPPAPGHEAADGRTKGMST
ncbi:MAG TPA: CPBP family intramembrane glutamic endopeptidase [Chloroflexota bacterium]|nr:CPBP family intramembrane glutamic endopeptidase [Chloroflexota bacterium]